MTLTAAGDREVVITRSFDAPRERVWDAYTKPDLLKRWLSGPPGWTLAGCEIDLRPGGRYRFVWRDPDGAETGMGGVYREVARPERLVYTELFDQDWTGGETVETVVLTEQDGRTLLTSTIRYASPEGRAAALSCPMEEGMAASYDELAAALAAG
ncbi:MAG: SRPBCC family protein [Gemmataceae bacterium]|nr:SRPBCC family protein [Gemmataceae bacterium]